MSAFLQNKKAKVLWMFSWKKLKGMTNVEILLLFTLLH